MARYKLRVGRRIQSATLVADAQHSWLAAISSAGVVGLIGGLWSPVAAAVAGLFITAFIIHIGYEVTSDLVGHLMDSVYPEVLSAAEQAAGSVPGVVHAHVRDRWMGRSLLVEVEGFVAPRATVEDGGAIGPAVEEAIETSVPEARAVLWTPRSTPAE